MSLKTFLITAAMLIYLPAIAQVNERDAALPIAKDTPAPSVADDDLKKIIDLRTQLRRRNTTFTRPATINDRLKQLIEQGKEDPVSYLSDEALRIILSEPPAPLNRRLTFRDTAIVNRLFLPIVFRSRTLPEKLNLDAKQTTKKLELAEWFPRKTVFEKQVRQHQMQEDAMKFVEMNNPSLIRYSERHFPAHKIILIPINTPVYEEAPIPVTASASIEDTEAPPKFIPDRLYWTSAFESAIQFSQNYVSANWYKGGSSNLNMYTRNYLRYDYNRDIVQFANEAELKATIYSAPNDTINSYKIGDDLLRFHSTLGIKAFPKWFYSLDAEFKTQLFTNYKENSELKQAAFLSPFSFNLGLGMKYDIEKTFKERGRKLKLNANIAPISLTYMKSIDPDVDLGRHGFNKYPDSDTFNNVLTRLGSTLRLDMTMSFNRNVSWQSRVYYFTTYEFTQFEFENTLSMALSQYFSTILYFHLRYDNAAILPPDISTFFQLNERISFGFNYKW
ncbi:MAG: DUF3078 domain-containing protein [Tannerellaceae bacterium]|jgi:hypothetical protein|nr:DUF3078 domain-containing protein [Tannerellaceae bacterium]